MDFHAVLELILKDFQRGNIRYGLIGGFALGALGVSRATIDLDFLINKEDLGKVDAIMKSHAYECVYKSENVSQYVSALKIFGEIDFLHAFRKISLGMLERAQEKDIFEGRFKIRVLIPEDIIGLKIQSLANNPARIQREYLDIEALMGHFGENLNWGLIEEYFSLFQLKEKFIELKAKYYHAK
ncbi:MAG: nucleotidyltransferase family protein [Candidatus Omnitrophica bacterium]|nr:nucleotidyltransferase family protein [Candidatus Omnitrophota bacterium]